MNELVAVVHIEQSVVKSIKTFATDDLENAEKLFNKIALALGCDKKDLEDVLLLDGYYEHPSEMGSSVCMSWINTPKNTTLNYVK